MKWLSSLLTTISAVALTMGWPSAEASSQFETATPFKFFAP